MALSIYGPSGTTTPATTEQLAAILGDLGAAPAQATAAAAYVKPADGVPREDLDHTIRGQLDLAGTALQPGALPAGTTLEAAQIGDATAAGRAVLTTLPVSIDANPATPRR